MVQVYILRRLKMYSLTELNDYSNSFLQFEDERPASYTTNPSNVANLPLSVVIGSEGDTHSIPLPFTIGNLISINMTYTINARPYTGATVSWNSFPGNVTLSIPTAGVYRLTNIRTQSEWDTVKQPLIYLGSDTSGNLTYTANLKPDANSTPISWTINAQLADTGEINTGVLPSFFYNQEEALAYNSGLLVTDTNPTGTYSIFISKSVNSAGNLTSSGTGGTSTASNGNLTIAGNKTQVNSHLGNLTFTPALGFGENLTITYAVTNISGNITNTATQLLKIGNLNNGITDMYFPRSYTSNQSGVLFANNVPYLSEVTPSDATYSISFTLNGNIGFLAQTNDYINRTGWNTNTLTYTYSGSLAQCNDKINNLKFYPGKNQFSNTTVTYTQRKNSFFQLSTTFDLTGIYSSAAIAGIGSVNFSPSLPYNTRTYNIADYITYERLYLLKADIMMIAGGGFSGTQITGGDGGPGVATFYGGGGGAGQLYRESNINLLALPLNATIQIGGRGTATIWSGWKTLAPGSNGVNGVIISIWKHWRPTFWNANNIPPDYTTLISPILTTYEQWAGYTAFIQGGGYWPSTYGAPSQNLYTYDRYLGSGGNSGNGFFGARGGFWRQVTANSDVFGGGGAGAAGHGTSPAPFQQGSGGAGVVSDISGTTVTWGRGANGGQGASNSPGGGGDAGYMTLKFYDDNPMPPIGSFGNIALVSNSSAYFPGNGISYLSGTLDSALGTGAFTVDFWIYPTDTNSSDRCIFDLRSTGGTASDGFAIRYQSTNQMTFIHAASLTSLSWNRTNNAWQHIAIVRSNNIIHIYVNGIQVGNSTSGGTTLYSNKTWRLGQFKDSTTSSTALLGYVDEFRVSNVARYAGNFLTPNYPFDADANTNLLLRFAGSNNSTVFVDSSFGNATITNNGNVRVNTSTYKF